MAVAVIIVIVLIVIVWWALRRNARRYKPDFPVHAHHEEAGVIPRGEDTHAEEAVAAEQAGLEPQPVVEPKPGQPLATETAAPSSETGGIPSTAGTADASVAEAPVAEVSALDTGARIAEMPPAGSAAVFTTGMVSTPETLTGSADEDTLVGTPAPVETIGEQPTRETRVDTLSGDDRGAPHAEAPAPGETAAAATAAEQAAATAQTPGPDDLAVLEGIGPRVKEVLAEAGIRTFAQLAATDVNMLRQILDAANLRFLDPSTWPEQAKLAAEGRMDELQTLMSQLRGGKRVGS